MKTLKDFLSVSGVIFIPPLITLVIIMNIIETNIHIKIIWFILLLCLWVQVFLIYKSPITKILKFIIIFVMLFIPSVFILDCMVNPWNYV